MNFTPGALVGTMKTTANFLSCTGIEPVVRDEGVVGQHRAGRHHLGARDDDAGIGLLLHVAADVADLVRRPVAVDRRMDDGVVDEGHALLAELVPALAHSPGRDRRSRHWRRASPRNAAL